MKFVQMVLAPVGLLVAAIIGALVCATVVMSLDMIDPKSAPGIGAVLSGLAALFQAVFAGVALNSLRHNRMAAEAATRGAEAANETLRHQRATSERELRAYLACKKTVAVNFGGGLRLGLTFHLMNFGATPVMSAAFRMRYAYFWDDVGPPDEDFLGGKPFDIGSLAPSDTCRVSIYSIDPLTSEEALAMSNGRMRMIAIYEVVYTDAFGQKRTTFGRIRVENYEGGLGTFNEVGETIL